MTGEGVSVHENESVIIINASPCTNLFGQPALTSLVR